MATRRVPKSPVDAASRGYGLLETLVALAVAALAALAASFAVRDLRAAIRLEAARSTLGFVLLDARRGAYLSEATYEVRLSSGATEAVLVAPSLSSLSTRLPRGIYVAASNRRGGVRFHPSGFADNATFVLADAVTGRRVEVVVSQRGRIH